MLSETFNSALKINGLDFFKGKVNDDIIQNLNPNFSLREYQKEAIGRSIFYFDGFPERKWPAHLLFHMATGSGKTLIMAANILYLYALGYRNFIFFTRLGNIIEKTKDNFLNPLSEKYLFAEKIKIAGKEVRVKEVESFEGANPDDINIMFCTTSLLHIRINNPKENVLTFQELENQKLVLLADEAHNLQAITKSNKKEEELEKTWEYTVKKKIFEKNPQNVLLEFTATIDLSDANIRNKYEDKIIYQYDLKQFRLDKYSKEIEVLEADLNPIDRALQAVVLSQYRRKIAEKNKIILKPVILFKSKSIKESKENYENFLTKISNLTTRDLSAIESRGQGTILEKAFQYFEKEKITFDNLIKELKEDFSSNKVMLLDSENIDEEKQIKLNSLENKNNEIRAIFAVNMLNEGWDVLNLFDIVRLYNTRDGKWDKRLNKYKPGPTTLGEAQLIGRGARYFPFRVTDNQDTYKRKFDDDPDNELRVIETLHYHCFKEPHYIQEIKSALTEIGIIPEKVVQRELFVKEEVRKRWQDDVIFINKRIPNPKTDIRSFKDAKIKLIYSFQLNTGEIRQELLLENNQINHETHVSRQRFTEKLIDIIDENIIRNAIDRLEFYRFNNLKRNYPHLKSIKEFIFSPLYLGGIQVEVLAPQNKISNDGKKINIDYYDKLKIILYVLAEIEKQTKLNVSEFKGSDEFDPRPLWDVFRKKTLKIDKEELERKELQTIYLNDANWFAQVYKGKINETAFYYGTKEEQSFLNFFSKFAKN